MDVHIDRPSIGVTRTPPPRIPTGPTHDSASVGHVAASAVIQMTAGELAMPKANCASDVVSTMILLATALAAMVAGWIGVLRATTRAWAEWLAPIALTAIGMTGGIVAIRMLHTIVYSGSPNRRSSAGP